MKKFYFIPVLIFAFALMSINVQSSAFLCQDVLSLGQSITKIGFDMPGTGNVLSQLYLNSDVQLVNTWEISQRGEGEQVVNTSGLRPGSLLFAYC